VGAGFLDRVEDILSTMLAQDGVRLPGARRLAIRDAYTGTLILDDGVHAELLRRNQA
jgi:hypothetical protein